MSKGLIGLIFSLLVMAAPLSADLSGLDGFPFFKMFAMTLILSIVCLGLTLVHPG